MIQQLKIVIAQKNFHIGAILENERVVVEAIEQARDVLHADLILFPELCITGYPPEDLLLRDDFLSAVERSKASIISKVKGIDAVISFPSRGGEGLVNAAAWIREGELIAEYHKQLLPNYSVFDEKRYFVPGRDPCVVEIKGISVGLTICEDIWFAHGPVVQSKAAGAELILALNASPFCLDKAETRKQVIIDRVLESNIPLIYAHNVGAQGELVFDGGSMAVSAGGVVALQGPFFKEALLEVICERDAEGRVCLIEQPLPRACSDETLIYDAIVLGIKTYVHRSGFQKVLVGLSGGIDSAVTLALAVGALGSDNVTAVLMPSRYTAQDSIVDATFQANHMKVGFQNISIDPLFDGLTVVINSSVGYAISEAGLTQQNLQARIRGLILMGLSNELNALVLTTGNKSEMAVGYATLYGDMVGGYAPIKDLFKGSVYRLANYINTLYPEPVIPNRVMVRAPTAELAPGQRDQDVLPPYDVLDGILERYIVHDQGLEQIVTAGYERETVSKIIKMVDKNEYKRRQAAPGVRISQKALGRDRRYPIVSGYS